MSHAVTITRTTTTTTTSALLLNTGYFKTLPGLLKLAQVILGTVCVGVTAHYVSLYNGYYTTAQLFFLLMTTTFLVASACLFLSCLMSLSTASIISKTLYELLYHGVAFILLLASSITLLIQVNDRHYRSKYYEALMAASIIGLVNTALYLLSTIFGYRSYHISALSPEVIISEDKPSAVDDDRSSKVIVKKEGVGVVECGIPPSHSVQKRSDSPEMRTMAVVVVKSTTRQMSS